MSYKWNYTVFTLFIRILLPYIIIWDLFSSSFFLLNIVCPVDILLLLVFLRVSVAVRKHLGKGRVYSISHPNNHLRESGQEGKAGGTLKPGLKENTAYCSLKENTAHCSPHLACSASFLRPPRIARLGWHHPQFRDPSASVIPQGQAYGGVVSVRISSLSGRV